MLRCSLCLAFIVLCQPHCASARRTVSTSMTRERGAIEGSSQLALNQSQALVVWDAKWDGSKAATGGSVSAGVGVFKSGIKVLKGKGDQEQLGDSLTSVGLLVLALAPADPSFTCLIVGGVLAGTGALISVFADGKNSTMDALKEGFQKVGVELEELRKQIANVHQDIEEMRGDMLELKNQDLEAYLDKTRSNYNMFIESLQYAKEEDYEALTADLVMLSKGLELDEYKTSPDRIRTYLSDIMRVHGGYRGYAMAAWKFQEMLGARLERFGVCMPAATSGRGLNMFVNMCTGHLEEDLLGYQSETTNLGLSEWIRAPKKLLSTYINQDHSLRTSVKKASDDLTAGYWFERKENGESDHSRCYEEGGLSEKALKQLDQIGAPAAADAMPELRRAIFHDCWTTWHRALELIVKIGRPTASYAIADLRRILADPGTIAKRGGPLKSQNLFLRKEAAEAIAKIAGPAAEDAIPDLVWSAQHDAHHNARATSFLAIGAIGGPAAAAVLPELRKVAEEEAYDIADARRDYRTHKPATFSVTEIKEFKQMLAKVEAKRLWQKIPEEIFDLE